MTMTPRILITWRWNGNKECGLAEVNKWSMPPLCNADSLKTFLTIQNHTKSLGFENSVDDFVVDIKCSNLADVTTEKSSDGSQDNESSECFKCPLEKSPTFFTRRSCSPSPSPSVRFSIDQRPNSPGRSSISVTKQETSKKINNTVSSSSSSHNRVVRNFQKKTCSCSPTTHPGSFRCSLHKASSSSTSSTRGSGQRTASYGLNFRRSAMTNSLVRIGTVEGGDLVKRALRNVLALLLSSTTAVHIYNHILIDWDYKIKNSG
ncbi:hypothetical protein CFP56_013012 [Quercus suber]|uniref:Uncharacterized protein n=1 Tax=Quercus suber TaxID=58331 RepID=A0AAW0M407_QUESU